MFIDKYKSFLAKRWINKFGCNSCNKVTIYSTRELTIEEGIKNNITDLFNDGS
jgi:hypothetical protein